MNAVTEPMLAALPMLVALLLLTVFVAVMVRLGLTVIEKRARSLWRLEAKIDLLLKNAGIEFDPYRDLPRDVLDAMAKGERIRAIANYRIASGVGLKEAMDFIDEAQRRASGRTV